MYKIAAQAALDEAGARKRRAAAGKALAERNRRVLIGRECTTRWYRPADFGPRWDPTELGAFVGTLLTW